MLAYKLFINGLKASFSGYNKGVISYNGIEYEWDNNESPTPVPVNPLSRDFTKQEVFDEFATAYKEDRTSTNPYGEDTFYRRPQNMIYQLTNDGLYMIANPGTPTNRVGVIKSFNLATTGKYRLDLDLESYLNAGHPTVKSFTTITSLFVNDSNNSWYFAFLLMYNSDNTYSVNIQYKDANGNKVTHLNVIPGIDFKQFNKYSVVLDFDNKVIDSYINDTLIETWSDNPRMASFGAINVAGTNNNSFKPYSPIILKSITVTEVE